MLTPTLPQDNIWQRPNRKKKGWNLCKISGWICERCSSLRSSSRLLSHRRMVQNPKQAQVSSWILPLRLSRISLLRICHEWNYPWYNSWLESQYKLLNVSKCQVTRDIMILSGSMPSPSLILLSLFPQNISWIHFPDCIRCWNIYRPWTRTSNNVKFKSKKGYNERIDYCITHGQ